MMEIKESTKGYWQYSLYGLLAGVAAGLILYFTVIDGDVRRTRYIAVFAMAAVAGVGSAVLFFIQAVRSKTMYVIDPTGITFNGLTVTTPPPKRPAHIPWSAIHHFDIVTSGIDVRLIDEDAFFATLSPKEQARIAKYAAMSSNYVLFKISTPSTTSKLEDVLRAIQSYTNKPINNVVGVILEY